MKNERSSHLVLLFLICSISVLHAIKLREQRFTRMSTLNERLIVTIPGVAAIIPSSGSSISSGQAATGN